MEKIETWRQRVWKDPVWSKVIANSIWWVPGAIYLIFPAVRTWAAQDLGNISRIQVILWFALGVTLGIVVAYLFLGPGFKKRATLQEQVGAAERQIQDDKVTTEPRKVEAAKPEPFKDIRVEDRVLHLEWHIKMDPTKWINDHEIKESTPAWRQSILAGPYHLAKDCGTEMARRWSQHYQGYEVLNDCPACRVRTFGPSAVRHDVLRSETISEIQRMFRNGTELTSPIVLAKPPYWHSLKPG